MSVFQSALDVRSTQRQGAVGILAGNSANPRIATVLNQNPQAKQITTTTVSDPGDNTDISIVINGYTITTNTGTGLDAAGIATQMAEDINADPRVRGDVVASSSSTTLTLTSTLPGADYAFTATESSASLTTPSTSQSAADAEAIPVGRGLIWQSHNGAEEVAALAKSSLLTAQVQTISVTYVASNLLNCKVYEVRGTERYLIGQATTVAATDRDTTLDALVTAINASLPANSVAVTADADPATALVFTAEKAGLEFHAEITRDGGGASAPTITSTDTTGPNRSTSIHRALAGVSMRPYDEEVSTIGGEEPEWPGNAGVRALREGSIYVESDESITSGDTVYIELGVTADNGQFFNSTSATRVALAQAMASWERDGSVSADSLAVLRLNIP